MPLNLTTATSSQTAEKIERRDISVGAVARSSKEWGNIPLEIRERAFFTATVGNVKVLSEMKSRISAAINQVRDSGGVMDKGRFVAEMKEYLSSQGYALGGTSVRDITSNRRLSLIYDMNVEEAKEFARYKNDLSSAVGLNLYPAWEFTRVHPRRKERRDWPERWKKAGGQIFDGRMIALKTSDVWAKLSVFGRPWAPFDFGSGMGCRDVRRADCVKYGLIQAKEKLTPKPVDFNASAKMSGNGIDDEFLKKAQLDGKLGKLENGNVFPRPNPFPVSDALNVEIQDAVLRGDVEEAIRIINTVHGDGNLPVIPVKTGRMKNAFGRFSYFKGGDPVGIELIKNNPHKQMTAIHEIGHFIDIYGLGTQKGLSAIDNGELEEIFEAIKNSEKWNEFSWNEYYVRPRECFARAYAQFIAEESSSKELKAELTNMLKTEPAKVWETNDFAPIRKAIKEAFTRLGWIKL